MKTMVFVFLAVFLAIAVTLGFAQEYDGQVEGGQTGSVEAIESPQELHPPVVGGRQLVCEQATGKVVGYSNPEKPTTASQDQEWRDYASNHGWINQSEASRLDAQILRKAKAYTDKKVRAVNQRVDRLNKRVHKVEKTVGEVKSKVDRLNLSMYGDGKNWRGVKAYVDHLNDTVFDEDGKPVWDASINKINAKVNQVRANISGAGRLGWIAILAVVILLLLYLRLNAKLKKLEEDYYSEDEEVPPGPPAPGHEEADLEDVRRRVAEEMAGRV